MRNSRYAVVILDSTGRPSRRLSVAYSTVQRGVWLVILTGLTLLGGMCHGLWMYRQANLAQHLVHENAHLRALSADLAAEVPAVQESAALAELNFAQLWAKSGLGVEPSLLDVTPLAVLPVADLDMHSLQGAVRHLTSESRELSTALGDTLEYFHDAARMLLNTPSIRPARAAWYSSSFGIRLHPISHTLLMHKGLDMGGFIGMEICAPADGVVIWTGRRGGYGQVVVIDHGYGLQTHFAHLNKYWVKNGQQVKRGQRIAEMGTTGHSTGPHLHYEVRRFGQPLDPSRFILD